MEKNDLKELIQFTTRQYRIHNGHDLKRLIQQIISTIGQ